jgi:hypothetical protein
VIAAPGQQEVHRAVELLAKALASMAGKDTVT